MIITIDGPAASGKSTIARALAHELHFYYISSGLIYRALAYVLLHDAQVQEKDLTHLDKKIIDTYINRKRFQYCYDEKNDKVKILFDDTDLTSFLKDEPISKAASLIGTNLEIRNALCHFQQELAIQHPNSIVEGRDAGTVVFPHATLKFFLTAKPEIRAQRLQKDQEKKGNNLTSEKALTLITERDKRDKGRKIAPLQIPEGAIVIDNSEINIQETVEKMLKEIKKEEE